STVTYPFTTFEGVTLDRQRTGDRVWDVNVGNRSGPGGDPVGDAERVLLVQDPRLPRPALAGGGHDLPGGPPGDQDALAGGGIQAQQHTGVGRPERGPDPGVDLDRGRVEVTGSLLITAGTAVGHDEQPHGPLTRAQLAPESPAAVGGLAFAHPAQRPRHRAPVQQRPPHGQRNGQNLPGSRSPTTARPPG